MVEQMHRYCPDIKWFGYDQMFCWLMVCVIDQINMGIPWHTDVADEVISEIEVALVSEFDDNMDGMGADDIGYLRAVDHTSTVLSKLMHTEAFTNTRETIEGCLEGYDPISITLLEVNFDLGLLTLELKR